MNVSSAVRRVFLAAAFAAFVPATVSAAILSVFTDRTAWENAVGGFALEDFETLPVGVLGVGTTSFGAFSITTNGTLLSLPSIGPATSVGDVNGSRQFNGLIASSFDPASASRHVFAFDAPLIGFAADFADTLSGTGLFLGAAGERVGFASLFLPRGDGFMGIVSDTAFSEVTLSATNEGFSLDDMSTAAASPPAAVPVPPAGALLGAGLVVLGLVRARVAHAGARSGDESTVDGARTA